MPAEAWPGTFTTRKGLQPAPLSVLGLYTNFLLQLMTVITSDVFTADDRAIVVIEIEQ